MIGLTKVPHNCSNNAQQTHKKSTHTEAKYDWSTVKAIAMNCSIKFVSYSYLVRQFMLYCSFGTIIHKHYSNVRANNKKFIIDINTGPCELLPWTKPWSDMFWYSGKKSSQNIKFSKLHNWAATVLHCQLLMQNTFTFFKTLLSVKHIKSQE